MNFQFTYDRLEFAYRRIQMFYKPGIPVIYFGIVCSIPGVEQDISPLWQNHDRIDKFWNMNLDPGSDQTQ